VIRGQDVRQISLSNESHAMHMIGNSRYFGGVWQVGLNGNEQTQTKCPSVSSGLCAKVVRTFCDENTVTSGGGGGGGGGE